MSAEALQQNGVSLFISYAHDDSDPYLKHLRMYLNKKNCPKVDVWHDELIPQDRALFPAINEKMMGADIVLFMVSPFFQESEFIENIEFPEVLLRYRKEECVIFPIKTKTCNPMGPYQELTLLKMYPPGDYFLDTLYNQNLQWTAYTNIQNAVNEEVNKIITKKKMNSDLEVPTEIRTVIQERKIFLSVPFDDSDARDNFLSWVSNIEKRRQRLPFRIVPSSSQAKELIKEIDSYEGVDKEEYIEELFKPYIDGAFCTIQLSLENNITHVGEKIQFMLSRRYDRKKGFRKTISWCIGAGPLQDKLKLNDVILGKRESKRVFEMMEAAYSSLETKIKEIAKKYGEKEVVVVTDLKNDDRGDESQILFEILWKYAFVTKFVPNDIHPKSVEDGVIFWGDNDENWFQINAKEMIRLKKRLFVLSDKCGVPLETKRACVKHLRDEKIIKDDDTIIEGVESEEAIKQFLKN